MTAKEEIETIVNAYAYKIAEKVYEACSKEIQYLKIQNTRLKNQLDKQKKESEIQPAQQLKKERDMYRKIGQRLKRRNTSLEIKVEALMKEIKELKS